MNSTVQTKKFKTPSDSILDPCARTFSGTPELKVFFSVVVAYGVLMVNAFSGLKRTAKKFFHDFAMLSMFSSFSVGILFPETLVTMLVKISSSLKIVSALFRAALLPKPVTAVCVSRSVKLLFAKLTDQDRGRLTNNVNSIVRVAPHRAEPLGAFLSAIVLFYLASNDLVGLFALQADQGNPWQSFSWHDVLLCLTGYHNITVLSTGRS